MKQSLGVVLNYPRLLKQKLNDLDYVMKDIKILTDAIEFEEHSDLVTKLLEANYEDHYGVCEEETYTKDEVMTMLEELKTEFEEYEPKWAENEDQLIASNRTWDDFDDIIQQKINALKENTDG